MKRQLLITDEGNYLIGWNYVKTLFLTNLVTFRFRNSLIKLTSIQNELNYTLQTNNLDVFW